MRKKWETIAFIPARGGSKSIPLKNIKLINGRPLIYWSIDAAVACDTVDTVVVSTDSDEIKAVVNQYNSSKVIVVERSQQVSTDIASTESVMIEFSEINDFKNMILIQSTSPLITSRDIERGFDQFLKEGIDSVLSVVRQKRFIWKELNDTFSPYNYNPLERPRRQEFDGYLVENGAFYITSRELLLKTKCRISGNISVVEMDEASYYELDEVSDWIIVESLLAERSQNKLTFTNLSQIKCVLSDCDGVLTDGGMYYSENGDELKKFNTRDGVGFSLLKEAGIITGIITGENTEIVKRRAVKLKVDEIFMGVQNKLEVLNKICSKYNLKHFEIAYIGDDVNDLNVLQKVGFGCVVQNGMPCVKEVAKYVTNAIGGKGAVREVSELILNAKRAHSL